MQIDTLVYVLNSAANIWLAAAKAEQEENFPKGGRHDGGIVYAAEETTIKSLERLNFLISDGSRWDMQFQGTLECMLAQMYAENTRVLQQTSYATALAVAPHTRFHPVLVRHGEEWLAVFGDMKESNSLIIGRGPTPHLALLSFDDAFLNGTRPVEIEKTKVKPETKKKKSR